MSKYTGAVAIGIAAGFVALFGFFLAMNPGLGTHQVLMLSALLLAIGSGVALLLGHTSGRSACCLQRQRTARSAADAELPTTSPDR